MEVQDLKINVHNRGHKEFNYLRVINLDKFFKSYPCNIDFYKTPFEILVDLESQIKYENDPEHMIFCGYKDDGDVIFRLVRIKSEGSLRVVEYEFDTFIS